MFIKQVIGINKRWKKFIAFCFICLKGGLFCICFLTWNIPIQVFKKANIFIFLDTLIISWNISFKKKK